jgi:hypothetical protein
VRSGCGANSRACGLLTRRSAERTGKYHHFAEALAARADASASVLSEARLDRAPLPVAASSPLRPARAPQVDITLACFSELQAQHAAAGVQARSLASACERLLSEKERLSEFAAALRAKLAVFETLDVLASQLHALAGAPAEASRLPPLLAQADASLQFLARHPQYADAAPYTLKFRQLHSRALSLVRSVAAAQLRRAGAGAAEARAAAHAEADPAAALYVRFRALLPDLRPLLSYAEARAAEGRSGEYGALMDDVCALYHETRARLLADHVAAAVAAAVAASDGDACALARSGSTFLLALSADEWNLYLAVFGEIPAPPGAADAAAAAAAEDAAVARLTPLMEALAAPLYDALRLAALRLRDLDSLAELIDVLQREVLSEAALTGGPPVRPALPLLARALADAQERLAFRAHTFLRHEVAYYVAAPEDEPCIRRPPDAAPPPARGDLYRPVTAALAALSRLYGAVDGETFGGLAQEAVGAALAAVHAAAYAGGSDPLDCHLFVAAQLLALREQIAPFDAQFVAPSQRSLDFSGVRGLVRAVLAGEAPPESLTAVAQPRTVETSLDGRKELERAVKTACEAFILAVTKGAIEPLLGFLAKATAAKGSAAAAAPAPTPAQPPRPLLSTLAFASAERVAELVTRTNAALPTALARAAGRARAYLPEGPIAAVLFRPIKANIAEAHAQMAALLEAEYGREAAAAVPLLEPEALRGVLDAALGA